jgi:hypothetical protein
VEQFLVLPALATYPCESLSQNDAVHLFYTEVLTKANPVIYQAYPFETVQNQQASHFNAQECM